MMTILVGCSGWSYDDWVGRFYLMELAEAGILGGVLLQLSPDFKNKMLAKIGSDFKSR